MKRKQKTIQKLWKEVSKALQNYYRAQNLQCLGRSKSCTGRATVMHHHFSWGSCLVLRTERRNLIPLCTNCHCSIHHGHTETAYNARKGMEAEYGTDWEDKLFKARLQTAKLSTPEMRDFLNACLEAYKLVE